jgi:carboxylesterase
VKGIYPLMNRNSKLALHNPHLEGDSFLWEGGPVGVLLSHGYTATTAEVRLLGRALHRTGYTVAGTLLPGHGTTPQEMNGCDWQMWAGALEESYQTLAARCERVFVGGESMGALLALYVASRHPEAAGILAYAPALKIARRIAFLARCLSPFVPHVSKKQLDKLNKHWQGYPVNPVPALVQLCRLQGEVSRRLPAIKQPLLIVQGRLDIDIDLKGVELLYQKIGSPVKELHWMENSNHVVILDKEVEQVVELTLSFMSRVLEGTAQEGAKVMVHGVGDE